MKRSIAATEICKSFGARTVLNGIDLDIQKGEIFGLLGPSGAGKTTLIKILTGQIAQDSGTAAINGNDSRKLSGDDRKRFGITMDNLRQSVIDGMFPYGENAKNKNIEAQFPYSNIYDSLLEFSQRLYL